MPERTSRRQVLTSEETAQRIASQLRQRRANPTNMWGVAPYGFATLDRWTGGIQTDDMILVAARPNVGKSSLTGQIAESVARYFLSNGIDKVVRIVTTEMSADACMRRLACAKAGISSYGIKSGYLSDMDNAKFLKALEYFSKLPIEYMGAQVSIDELADFVTKGDTQCGLWVLDHVGLVKDVTSAGSNSYVALGNTSKRIQQLCRAGYPGIVVAHMGRSSENNQDKRPALSNLAGSDQFGRDADVVIALHRPDMYMQRPEDLVDEPEIAEMIVLKGRDVRTGTIKVYWFPQYTMYKEAEEDKKKKNDKTKSA